MSSNVYGTVYWKFHWLVVCLSILLVSLLLVSSAPHQEPRFLMPMLIPMIICALPALEVVKRRFWVFSCLPRSFPISI